MKTIEIGEALTLDTDVRQYIVHCRGNPAKEAEVIKALLDKGWFQSQIAQEMKLSQGQISKRLSLFKLIGPLFKQLKDGKLKPSVAYQLAKLDGETQLAFSEQKGRITLKAVEKERRQVLISDRLLEALADPELGSVNGSAKQDKTLVCPHCGAAIPVE